MGELARRLDEAEARLRQPQRCPPVPPAAPRPAAPEPETPRAGMSSEEFDQAVEGLLGRLQAHEQ
eukprot:1152089-Alexandrium_andersonii.AAC.1